jgi:hypothetical protein
MKDSGFQNIQNLTGKHFIFCQISCVCNSLQMSVTVAFETIPKKQAFYLYPKKGDEILKTEFLSKKRRK